MEINQQSGTLALIPIDIKKDNKPNVCETKECQITKQAAITRNYKEKTVGPLASKC